MKQKSNIKTEKSKPRWLQRLVRRLEAYIGEDVIIEWQPETNGYWPTFNVVKVESKKGRVWLKGIDDQDGNKHDGDTFWCPVIDIKTVVLW